MEADSRAEWTAQTANQAAVCRRLASLGQCDNKSVQQAGQDLAAISTLFPPGKSSKLPHR